MKKFVTSIVLLAVLGSMTIGQSHAAPLKIDVKTKGDIDRISVTQQHKDKLNLEDKSNVLLNLLEIQSASIAQGGRALFRATLKSNSVNPINAQWTLSLWSGGKWAKVRSGNVVVLPNRTESISEKMFGLPGLHHYKFDVSEPKLKIALSKRIKFTGRERPKKEFVLEMTTSGPVVVHVQVQKGSKELIGTAARQKAAECKAEGFATKVVIKHDYAIIGDDTYTSTAYAQANTPITKVFDTEAERDAYVRFIFKLVPSFTNDGNGLRTKKFERTKQN